jgi:DNA-directed RNA polymerase subunit delta
VKGSAEMSNQYTLKIPADQAKELPMVDLAFSVLKAANTPFYYRDLMMEIAKIKGFSDDVVMQVIAQLYTEINVDGRFACVGNNLWGLKRWYPIDNKSDDAMGNAKRPRIINDEDDDMDEDDGFAEEEDTYVSDGEGDFDSFDQDHEEIAVEEDEEEDLFAEDDEVDEELDEVDLADADESLSDGSEEDSDYEEDEDNEVEEEEEEEKEDKARKK